MLSKFSDCVGDFFSSFGILFEDDFGLGNQKRLSSHFIPASLGERKGERVRQWVGGTERKKEIKKGRKKEGGEETMGGWYGERERERERERE